ncbi:olfactory receptor 2AT4-like [Paramormyrops kingsleyae]|uniref:Olfactory receptor n=1 Tax=Paramormyrops kingsleyae TaxID=1676925 RepID=A0A3B3SN33_9TELE|nr:olfactory receptor 2AT4-like [Paramormyrops kingsleyae]
MSYQDFNATKVTEFIILGFPGLQPSYFGLISVVLLFVYLAIVGGNSFILTVIVIERNLQKPTYLLYCNLAMSDLIFATTTLPKVIARYLAEDKIISFNACFLQMFIIHVLGGFNSWLLMIMALDRYVAICNPLRYQALIKNSTILILCGICWLISLIWMTNSLIHSVSLPYCNSNVIVQCYCDHISVTSLACENAKEVQVINLSVAILVWLAALIFIIFSYISIILSVMKTASSDGRYKILSTCSPQLFIICLHYIPRCFVYIANTINLNFSADFRILMIMLYSVFPPMVNPLIYCLKTKEIKDTLVRRWKI